MAVVDDHSPNVGDLLAFLLSRTDDAVVVVDGNGRIESWNQAASRLLGHAPDEVLRAPATLLLADAEDPESAATLEAALDRQPVDGITVRLRSGRGDHVVARLHAAPHGGGLALLLEDLTERQETQQVLSEAQERLLDLQALGQVGLWHWDPKTDEVQWSGQLSEIHDLDPSEFAGTFAAHVASIQEDSRDRVSALLKEAAAAGAGFDEEYPIVTPSGERRWVYSRATPVLDLEGDVVRLTGITQDITSSREMLAAAEKARADLDHFASTVAHDLKEPLIAITGFTHLMAEDVGPEGATASMLERVSANARRATKLIDDLLAEARRPTIDGSSDDVDLGLVVGWVVGTLEELLTRTGSHIEYEKLPVARGHEPLLQQALLNCVGNAIKYRRDGQGARIRISGEKSPTEWLVRIEDDGPGIPPEDRDRVLVDGQRLDRDIARGIEGTGIGLATVRKVAERHGGSIAIEDSTLGGACVVLRFPIPSHRA